MVLVKNQNTNTPAKNCEMIVNFFTWRAERNGSAEKDHFLSCSGFSGKLSAT